MRTRLLDRGASGFADYEVLEMLLFLGVPRRDTKPLAKSLINRFGSLAGVLQAPAEASPELTPACGEVFALVRDAARRLASAEANARPALSDWARLAAYLRDSHGPEGETRALYLDSRNRLIADEPIETSSIRPLLARALAHQAGAVVLATFRAAARIRPGDADALHDLRIAAETVSVAIHDHVVVGDRLLSVATGRALD